MKCKNSADRFRWNISDVHLTPNETMTNLSIICSMCAKADLSDNIEELPFTEFRRMTRGDTNGIRHRLKMYTDSGFCKRFWTGLLNNVIKIQRKMYGEGWQNYPHKDEHCPDCGNQYAFYKAGGYKSLYCNHCERIIYERISKGGESAYRIKPITRTQ